MVVEPRCQKSEFVEGFLTTMAQYLDLDATMNILLWSCVLFAVGKCIILSHFADGIITFLSFSLSKNLHLVPFLRHYHKRTVYVLSCDVEKFFNFDKTVDITSHVRFIPDSCVNKSLLIHVIFQHKTTIIQRLFS